MLTMHNDQIDDLISESLKQLEKEAELGMPDPETAWMDFEKALKRKKSRHSINYKKHYAKIALIAVLAVAILLSSQSEKVTAFKNEVFVWFTKDTGKEKLITQTENPNIEAGMYNNLTFEEAQEMVMFHLKLPDALPEGINETPEIDVEVIEYPFVTVTMNFEGQKGKKITLFQENSTGDRQQNTFVPENVDTERFYVKGKEVIFIGQNSVLTAQWTDNGIWYQIIARKITKNEFLKILNNIC